MVTMGVFAFQGKTHIVEPANEPGTSWLVVRSSDHQDTRLVGTLNIVSMILIVSEAAEVNGYFGSFSVYRRNNIFIIECPGDL